MFLPFKKCLALKKIGLAKKLRTYKKNIYMLIKIDWFNFTTISNLFPWQIILKQGIPLFPLFVCLIGFDILVHLIGNITNQGAPATLPWNRAFQSSLLQLMLSVSLISKKIDSKSLLRFRLGSNQWPDLRSGHKYYIYLTLTAGICILFARKSILFGNYSGFF